MENNYIDTTTTLCVNYIVTMLLYDCSLLVYIQQIKLEGVITVF